MIKKSAACKTNKEALRWCKSNRVAIEFDNWKELSDESHIPPGITCSVRYSPKKDVIKVCIDKTLMMSVNKMIRDKQEYEKKSGVEKKPKALKLNKKCST